MKKILLSLAVAALGTTAFAGEVQEVLTVNLFNGITKATTYADVDYTSELTGITYKGNIASTAYDNGPTGNIQLRTSGSKEGIVITSNPKGAIFKSLKCEAGSGTAAAREIQVWGNMNAYTAATDLYSTTGNTNQGTMIGNGVINDNPTISATDDNYPFIGIRDNSGACYIAKIIITYEIAGETGKKAADLVFDQTSFTISMGDTFNKPTLTKGTNADVVYSSSDNEVATVEAATGNVSIIGAGTVIITATASENDEYYGGTASYTLTVLPEDVVYFNACTTADCGFTSIYATDSFNPWSIDATYGLKASAYKSSTANASDAVMASPVIDLSNRQHTTLSFEHVLNQFLLNNVMLSTVDEALQYISVVAREEGATEWTKLSNPVLPEAYAWSPWAKSGDIDLSAFDGKKTQIGFRYISTSEIAGTWEIKNVEVKGEKTNTGIVDTLEESDDVAPVYYNLQGVRIDNPSKGLYIKVQGSKTTKVLVK